MIFTYQIEGLTLQTGDIICTMNGKPDILPGEFWLLVGRLVPGDVDHVAIYVGPDGRCVESGSRGVILFDVHDGIWDTEFMARKRGMLFDTFYGVAYPLGWVGTLGRGRNAYAYQSGTVLPVTGWQIVQSEFLERRDGANLLLQPTGI